jgi:hypothetical protein
MVPLHLAVRLLLINTGRIALPVVMILFPCKSDCGSQDVPQPGCRNRVLVFASLVGGGLDHPYVYLAAFSRL